MTNKVEKLKQWGKPSIKSSLPLKETLSGARNGRNDGGTNPNGKNFS